MKITARIGSNGKIKRQVDFEGATLPDGRSIEGILNENEFLKTKINQLREDFEYSKDIVEKALDKAGVPKKYKVWIKTVVDLVKLIK